MNVPTSGAWAAALLAALAGLLLLRPRAGPPSGSAPRLRHPGPVTVAGLAAVLAVVGLPGLTGRRLVLALLAVGVLLAALRLVQRSRRAERAARRADQVLAACDSIEADLAAGQPPLTALERAAREWPELAPVVAAAHLGAEVPGVLRGLAGSPGAGELRMLAAAWQVGHESGCGLADAVGAAAGAVRERQATRRLVAAELAAANATARLMGALPFGVLLLGAGVGGDPLGFLTGTSPGLGCLAAGLALAYLGTTWLHRIADQVLHR